ncbi:hypothetical protein LOC68_09740 [Blastopirellula sp. JC732]|uniref:Carboxypeptidase regulatory-like domain-containing protein n=1 Tax=Blastopirellula sediminis TaxID=2894196 RepID=A0A9X1SJ42_9BACT|nr:hypothetical protein [Blastopirellula sediminis]MCC9608544.1 hypothetical protein [Blastopirellula sediminis]MCC9628679.1 hypothetical protein [Blastopirellula sediminis]
MKQLIHLALILPLTAWCFGCNQNGAALAPTSGTVTADGKPVNGGTITFIPAVEGKPSSGAIQSDGTFKMTTYKDGDGVVIGSGTISFSPPPVTIPEDLKPGQSLPTAPYSGYKPAAPNVTIVSGSNTLTVELTK